MSVKYTRLPTNDQNSMVFEYQSAFDYSSTQNYKTIHRYHRNENPHIIRTDNQSFLMRLVSKIIIAVWYVVIVVTFPISFWFVLKRVSQSERLVIFRLGLLQPAKGPGMVLVLPCLDRWKKVDMRMRAFNVPPQRVLTQNSAVIEAGADVQFRINDVTSSITRIQDLNQSLRILGQTSLINHLGKLSSDEIDSARNHIAQSLQQDLNKMAKSWGAEIQRVQLSDIKLIHEGENAVNKIASLLFPQAENTSSTEQMNLLSVLTGGTPVNTVDSSHGGGHLVSSDNSSSIDMTPMTPMMIIDKAKQALNTNIVGLIGAVYKFDLQGYGGGSYYLDVKHGEGSAGKGEPPTEPDVTLSFDVADLGPLLSGKLEPFQAYMDGRIQLSGDMGSAMKLEKLADWIRRSGLTMTNLRQPGAVFEV